MVPVILNKPWVWEKDLDINTSEPNPISLELSLGDTIAIKSGMRNIRS